MKLYVPKYVKNFRCIADKCNHSCCIGWEIDVDRTTFSKYQSLNLPYSKEILNSIENTGEPHFKIKKNKCCTHLNDEGLCQIILNCGEEYLCDICREHPRYYNYTNLGKEMGIGMSCEEACRIILSSDDYDELIPINDVDCEIEISDFDAINMRELVYKILKDNQLDFDGKVEALFDYFDIFVDRDMIFDTVPNLEYLDINHKILLSTNSNYCHKKYTQDMLCRILAYFVYRHCSEAYTFDEFFTTLSFAIFCTKLIEYTSTVDTIFNIARIVSEEIEYSEENTDKIQALFYL